MTSGIGRLIHLTLHGCSSQANKLGLGSMKRLNAVERCTQQVATQVGLDSDNLSGEQTAQSHAASLVQQLGSVRAELSSLQEAQLSSQADIHTAAADSKLTELQHQLDEQSSAIRQLHDLMDDLRQDNTSLQMNTAAQERVTTSIQQSHQELATQLEEVRTYVYQHSNDMGCTLGQLEEQYAVTHVRLSEEVSQHHTDLGKLMSRVPLLEEQLQQNCAMVANHQQQLASRETDGAETSAAALLLPERSSNAASSSSVVGQHKYLLTFVCAASLCLL